MVDRRRWTIGPLGLALSYGIFGTAYILFSDSLLRAVVGDVAQYQVLQTAKGWGFILVTSVALWVLTRRALDRLTRIAQTAVAAEDQLRLALTAAGGMIWHQRGGPGRGRMQWEVIGGLARQLALPEAQPLPLADLLARLHPADRDAFGQWVRAPGADGLFRFRAPEGGLRWIKLVPDPAAPRDQDRIGVAFDLTEQQEVSQDFAEVIFGAELGTWRLDLTTRRNKINDRWAQLLGYDRAELEPMTEQKFFALVHPEDGAEMQRRQAERVEQKYYLFSDEIRMRHKDGHWVWILSRSRPVEFTETGMPLVLSGVHVDISRRKALEADLQQERDFLRGLTETSVSGILAVTAEGAISFANREAGEILGVAQARLVGAPLERAFRQVCRLDGTPLPSADFPYRRALTGSDILRGQRLLVHLHDGTQKAISVNVARMRLSDGQDQVVACVTDITAQLATEEALRAAAVRAQDAALHDPMTGLPNRRLFEDHLGAALAEAARTGGGLLHAFLDLDNFKQVNDRFGHAVGDLLIRAVGQRLERLRGKDQVLARVAGDEFTFLHPLPPRGALPPDPGTETDEVLAALAKAFERPFDLGGRLVYVTVSIGVSLYPQDGATAGDLWVNADLAMYEAKARGRNQTVRFTPALRHRQVEEARIAQVLQRALQARAFSVVLQPVHHLSADRSLAGAEALLRCTDPELAGIGPGDFLPVAERTGLARAIDLLVIERVGEATARLRDLGRPLRISVNLSPDSLRRADFGQALLAQIRRVGLGPADILFELTEGALVDLTPQARETLDLLHGQGFALSADDFGTGYSSLSYLHRLRLAELKIDRSFIQRLGQEDEPSDEIVAAILAMSKALGLRVVAEGIETEAQCDWLLRNGCGFGQGYHFGRGVDVETFARTLLHA